MDCPICGTEMYQDDYSGSAWVCDRCEHLWTEDLLKWWLCHFCKHHNKEKDDTCYYCNGKRK